MNEQICGEIHQEQDEYIERMKTESFWPITSRFLQSFGIEPNSISVQVITELKNKAKSRAVEDDRHLISGTCDFLINYLTGKGSLNKDFDKVDALKKLIKENLVEMILEAEKEIKKMEEKIAETGETEENILNGIKEKLDSDETLSNRREAELKMVVNGHFKKPAGYVTVEKRTLEYNRLRIIKHQLKKDIDNIKNSNEPFIDIGPNQQATIDQVERLIDGFEFYENVHKNYNFLNSLDSDEQFLATVTHLVEKAQISTSEVLGPLEKLLKDLQSEIVIIADKLPEANPEDSDMDVSELSNGENDHGYQSSLSGETIHSVQTSEPDQTSVNPVTSIIIPDPMGTSSGDENSITLRSFEGISLPSLVTSSQVVEQSNQILAEIIPGAPENVDDDQQRGGDSSAIRNLDGAQDNVDDDQQPGKDPSNLDGENPSNLDGENPSNRDGENPSNRDGENSFCLGNKFAVHFLPIKENYEDCLQTEEWLFGHGIQIKGLDREMEVFRLKDGSNYYMCDLKQCTDCKTSQFSKTKRTLESLKDHLSQFTIFACKTCRVIFRSYTQLKNEHPNVK